MTKTIILFGFAGGICFFLLVFGPSMYRALRADLREGYTRPVGEPTLLARLKAWWLERADDLGGLALIILVLVLLALSLIISCHK